MLVTNESNFQKIHTEFTRAKREILICSAWITSSNIYRVLDHRLQERIKSGKLKLRVLIRLGVKDDIKITDQGVFKLIEDLGEHTELRYHKKLHAKMYLVEDSWAMLGSFNLTGGGFGDEARPGTNPEADRLGSQSAGRRRRISLIMSTDAFLVAAGTTNTW